MCAIFQAEIRLLCQSLKYSKELVTSDCCVARFFSANRGSPSYDFRLAINLLLLDYKVYGWWHSIRFLPSTALQIIYQLQAIEHISSSHCCLLAVKIRRFTILFRYVALQ